MFTPDDSFWQAARALVVAMNAPITVANLKFLAAWSYCEKPHYAGAAWEWNNPWNTTMACCGYTRSENSARVKRYPTHAAGIQATVQSLALPDYTAIVQALHTGTASALTTSAVLHAIAVWGTSPFCVSSDFATISDPPSQYLASSPAPIVQRVQQAPVSILPSVLLALGLLGIGTDVAWVEDQRTGHWFFQRKQP